MKANGKDRCAMGLAYKFGQMELDMRECGKIIRQAGEESSFMWMVIFSKGNGRTIRLMEMVSTGILTVLFTMAVGRMISNMGMELRHGLMDQSI